jgi:hypothetical protein
LRSRHRCCRHFKKHFEQSAPIVCARGNAYRLNIINSKKEMFMSKTVTLGRRLVPLEQIALIEPFEPAAHSRMQTDRPFKARVVLLNRDSILTEEPPELFAEAQGFRMLTEDGVATNPQVHFAVESFHPAEGFNPTKPYLSRLVWRDLDGNTQSKLLLTAPEHVLAVAVRGELGFPSGKSGDVEGASAAQPAIRRRSSQRQTSRVAPVQG